MNELLTLEMAVVGGMMMFPEQSVVLADNHLEAQSFNDPQMRHAYQAILNLLESNQAVDVLSVFDEANARKWPVSLEALNSAFGMSTSIRSLDSAAKRLAQAHSRSETIRALKATLDHATQNPDPEAILDFAQSVLSRVQAHSGKSQPKIAADLAKDRMDYYERLLSGQKISDAMPTHIPKLDRALNGGLQPGRLYILAARPSVGKSSFSQYLALTLAKQGRSALFLSLEMPASEVIDRAVASLGKASYQVIQTGEGATDDDWTGIAEGLERLSALPFYIDDQPGLSLQHIRAKAHAIKRKGLDVLVVDYLQLCEGSGDNRNAVIESITKGLKILAKELGIAVIALSQLNREVEKRAGQRPQLSDLRDSGAIEQDADVVMFLWRPEQKDEGLIGLAIDKNRQGKRDMVALEFRGELQRWGQSTENLAEKLKKPAVQSRGLD